MSAKKRVRFAEEPDIREFETEYKKSKKELDPMEQLEGARDRVYGRWAAHGSGSACPSWRPIRHHGFFLFGC
jgi:hypothetical protein